MENSNIRVNYAPGQLPVFWDRSVIFFANLLALFYGNEGATQELTHCVGGVETYGGRLCPLINLLFTGPRNLLVLESHPDEHLLAYFSEELELSLPEVVVLPHDRYNELGHRLARGLGTGVPSSEQRQGDETPEEAAIACIANHPADWIDGFVTDDVLSHVAQVLGKQTLITPAASRQGNNKLLLHQFLQSQGFPVFDTVIVESAEQVPAAAADLDRRGYRQMVAKSQVGASGIGMCKFNASDPSLGETGEHMFYEGPVLVQGWLDSSCDGVRLVGSPSMQLFLDESTVNVYDVTEQILSEQSVHEGNCSPPPFWRKTPEIEAQMHQQVAAVGRWLHENGYRGTASADFLVVQREGRTEVYVCEVNARVTGATYPSVLARRFCPDGHWLMRNLRLEFPMESRELLVGLRRKGHLLDAASGEGVVPVNFNLNDEGLVIKGQFLCVGADEHTCLEYLMAAADVLPAKWTYDRD